MPTATKPPLPLPPPAVVLIDPATGRPTREFYDLLRSLHDLVSALRTEIP